ncbi:MAG: hypothetical protein CVV11_00430 [Gammaproteobacteria bacterium HGW-Gammaproteobacteria-15]|nr:MAG: hypothetical protein CVV11_00430 [Gammaproteobacteria bacterium HGW-Gammaproteobacteria-15]
MAKHNNSNQIRVLLQRRLELLERLLMGEQAVFEGRTCSQAEAREKMSKWLAATGNKKGAV